MKNVPISWRNVLNADLKPVLWGIEEAIKICRKTGYPYLAWNGWVYAVPAPGKYFLSEPTGVKVEQLNAQEIESKNDAVR